MSAFLVRLLVLALTSALLSLLVWSGRRFVETRRQQALAAEPPAIFAAVGNTNNPLLPTRAVNAAPVRILAFSSADCHQCHQLQAPALQRVQETRGTSVSVVEIDAPSSPELTQRYHVLTVPSTVILDVEGHAQVVNYGFANTRRLLEQVDGVLAKAV